MSELHPLASVGLVLVAMFLGCMVYALLAMVGFVVRELWRKR